MRLGSELVYSPPSTAVAENRWTYTVCLHAVDRDKFTSTFSRVVKASISNFTQTSRVGVLLVHVDRQTDGRKNPNDELISGFCDCANVAKIDYV